MTAITHESKQITTASRESALQQKLAALVFGVLVILGVGFLPMDIAHNAAHDTRHSLVFPCH